MTTRAAFLPAFALAVCVLMSPAAAQKVWVVAPVAGAGVDFTVIQDAVDAAADGDIVLVRAGSYAGFELRSKGLTIIGEASVQLAIDENITIRDVQASQSVLVRGFGVSTNFMPPLSISNCAGPVTVESSGFTLTPVTVFASASSIASSSRVTLIDCFVSCWAGLRASRQGLAIGGSTVHMFGCTVSGGDGSSAYPVSPGVTVGSSFVYAAGSTIRGGQGTPGAAIGGICFVPPGNGGDALVLSGATVNLLDTVLMPGLAGFSSPGCPAASAGSPWAGQGTVTTLAGSAATLTTSSPVRAGQSAVLSFEGPPGAGAWLMISPDQNPIYIGPCGGTLLASLVAPAVVLVGIFPASGQLVLNVPIPHPLPVEGASLFLQMGAADPMRGCVLGSPTGLTLLDPRF